MIIRVRRVLWWASQIFLAVAAMFTGGLMFAAVRERQWAAAFWCGAVSVCILRVLAFVADDDPDARDD